MYLHGLNQHFCLCHISSIDYKPQTLNLAFAHLTLVVFGTKWWIHDHCVKLLGMSFSLQAAQVTLDQVHVGRLKLLCVSSEYLQSVVVNVKADTQAVNQTRSDNVKKTQHLNSASHPASSITAPMLRTPQPHPRSATSLPSMSSNVVWIVYSMQAVEVKRHKTHKRQRLRVVDEMLSLTSDVRAGWILFEKDFGLFECVHLL